MDIDCLPASWSSAALAEVAELNPALPERVPADAELVSFVPMSAVEANTGRLDASQARPWLEVKRGFTRFQEGDVLFAKITPSMENGKCALASGLVGGRGAGSTEFHVLRCADAADPSFLLYYLLQETFRREARMKMKGVAGQLRVPHGFMAEAALPVPPLPEQQRIVAEIEKHLTRLDAAVAALERARANLKRYRASVLKAACEGRLVPTEAELSRAEGRDYEPADVLLDRVLLERRARWEADQLEKMRTAGREPKDDRWKAKYKEPAAPETDGLPELPAGWTWAQLEQLIGRDGIFRDGDWVESKDQDPGGDVRLIQLADVGDGRYTSRSSRFLTSSKAQELRCTYLMEGDLLVARMPDPLGRACIFPGDQRPAVTVVDVCIIRTGLVGPDHRWLMLTVNSAPVRSKIAALQSGTTRKRISRRNLATVWLPVAPVVEQQRIVEETERRFSVLDELDIAIERGLLQASHLRQSVLKSAFEGKLVRQDPNDEPASVLLERVRAEREAEATQAKKRATRRRPTRRAKGKAS